MGRIANSIALAVAKLTLQAINTSVSNRSFEKGKQGERPLVLDSDPELQKIAERAYKAGQMASFAQSAKKFSDK
jgi:hypothetical protein